MTFDTGRVRAVVQAQLADDVEAGASLCVMVDGKEVLCEAWGMADASRAVPYTPDSLQMVMSIGKGVMGALAAILIERGLLEPGERVARYWQEFAAAGKQDVTVAQLLSHQAGVALLDGGISLKLLADRQAHAEALAKQPPLWEPGSGHGYHAITMGGYGEMLFERVSGKTMNGLLEELGSVMGAEIYSGLPQAQWGRAVKVHPALPRPGVQAPAIDPASMVFRVLSNMPEVLGGAAFWNGEGIRGVSLPGTNMFSNPRSLARLYAGLVAGGVWNGQRLASPEAIALATTERVRGIDKVNGAEMAYGLLFQKPCAFSPFSPNPAAYGHAGVGGSIAFADPDAGLAMAWIPSRFSALSFDSRVKAVIDAVYASI